jgi:hypothetical protein
MDIRCEVIMAESKNGSKASIREVRDLIDKLDDEKISPMKVILARIETKLDIHLKSYSEYRTKNDKEHENFITSRAIKLTASLLGLLISLATIWNTYIFFAGV